MSMLSFWKVFITSMQSPHKTWFKGKLMLLMNYQSARFADQEVSVCRHDTATTAGASVAQKLDSQIIPHFTVSTLNPCFLACFAKTHSTSPLFPARFNSLTHCLSANSLRRTSVFIANMGICQICGLKLRIYGLSFPISIGQATRCMNLQVGALSLSEREKG